MMRPPDDGAAQWFGDDLFWRGRCVGAVRPTTVHTAEDLAAGRPGTRWWVWMVRKTDGIGQDYDRLPDEQQARREVVRRATEIYGSDGGRGRDDE